MLKKNFYITTTLPYINSDPHIGFAAEIIKADVIARYARQQGSEVFFNTGTDEHGLKIYQKALTANLPIQEYCDIYAEKFQALKGKLNLSYTNFIRTTDENHTKAAQEFWKRCEANGDIYKKNYKVKYCVGCEMEKTDSDLVNGKCPLHPNAELEIIDEENYFFRYSKYQDKLLALYEEKKDFVIPAHRLKEIRNFIEPGLQDFSISRLKSKMPNGIGVPGDETQVMYVWFDALVNYISCLGWPENENDPKGNYQKFWPGIQVCGKDNLRPQSAMWQAMLMSAGVPNSEQILVFGFLTIDGQKISKSAGNSVDPDELVDKYGCDAVRYYLLSEMSPFEDGDYSDEKFQLKYNADLANGIGNLSARVSNLLEKNNIDTDLKINLDLDVFLETNKAYNSAMASYAFNDALQIIWNRIRSCDELLSKTTPWKLTDVSEVAGILKPVAQDILNIAYLLEPFMPECANKIQEQFKAKQIKKGISLFQRL